MHEHRYVCGGTVSVLIDSEHVALFAHGVLLHSSTSTSQFPEYSAEELSRTEQSAV
jgi:hypothetical protein